MSELQKASQYGTMVIKIKIDVAVVVAAVVAEVVSLILYSEQLPWRQPDVRYLIPSLVGDFGLAVVLQWIIMTHWYVRDWRDGLSLGLFAGCLYAALSAPHSVWGPSSAISLAFNSVYKAAIVSVMALTMFYVRKAGY